MKCTKCGDQIGAVGFLILEGAFDSGSGGFHATKEAGGLCLDCFENLGEAPTVELPFTIQLGT